MRIRLNKRLRPLYDTVELSLEPATDDDFDALMKMKDGDELQAKPIGKRVSKEEHNKYFKLLRVGFSHWTPAPIVVAGETLTPTSNFEAFRQGIIIMAGYRDVVGYPDGSVKPVAHSLVQIEAAGELPALWSSTIDILLQICTHGMTREQLVEEAGIIEDEILQFA